MPTYRDETYTIRDNQFWYNDCSFAEQIKDKQSIKIRIAGLGERTVEHSAVGINGQPTLSFKFGNRADRDWWGQNRGESVQVELLAIEGEAVGSNGTRPGGIGDSDPIEDIPNLDKEVRFILQEMPDFYVNRQQNFIWTGFDSAWKGVNHGAIAWITGSSNELVFHQPQEATFEDCIHFIDSKTLQSDMHLLMIDQPTIVRNEASFRPVERAVGHEMGRAKSAVQPGNRKKKDMFGEDAPIWSFLAKLKERGFQESTAKSFNAKEGKYYLETYPAFGNLGLFGYTKCPKYNPPLDSFSFSNWKKLCRHIGQVGEALNISGLKRWAENMFRCADEQKKLKPSKKDQDFLDAVLCMLFGYIWWRSGLKHSIIIGEDETGYMVVPCLRQGLRTQLNDDAGKHGVLVDELFPKKSTDPVEQPENLEVDEQLENPVQESQKAHSRLSQTEQQQILDSPPIGFHISCEPLCSDNDKHDTPNESASSEKKQSMAVKPSLENSNKTVESSATGDSKKGFLAKLFWKIFG